MLLRDCGLIKCDSRAKCRTKKRDEQWGADSLQFSVHIMKLFNIDVENWFCTI